MDPQTHVVESENKLLSLNFDVTMYVVKRTRKEKKDFGRQACKASKPDKQTERGQVACLKSDVRLCLNLRPKELTFVADAFRAWLRRAVARQMALFTTVLQDVSMRRANMRKRTHIALLGTTLGAVTIRISWMNKREILVYRTETYGRCRRTTVTR